MSRITNWVRPTVRGLKPYYKAPLEGDPLRLDQNTNLHGSNPAIHVEVPRMDQYPTRDSDDLLGALAQAHNLTPDHFLVGNGSDEILDILTKTFTAPGQTMVVPAPSYSLYPFYAKLQGAKLVEVPLTHAYQLDVPAIVGAKPALVILATPNNPTGNCLRDEDLEQLLAQVDGVVVLDEAYIEYAGDKSWINRVDEYDNLAVMRTFSKAHGLAGLRVGYLAANPELAAKLRLVKPPFNLNKYSEAVACQAIQQQGWLQAHVADVQAERERLSGELVRRGFKVHPSEANFLLTEHPLEPAEIAGGLQQRGILVRTFAGKPGLERKVRFGIGMPEHTDQLLTALDEVLA